jgi:tryptophan-rich sensory protein
MIIGLFLVNAFFNAYWCYLFFTKALINEAFIEMFLLNGTTITLIILLWNKSRKAATLLIPYVLWVSFATFLTYSIKIIN